MNMSELVNFSWMSQPSAWIGLVTLIALEIVLGIDNIVFLTILSGKLPKEDQPRGQKLGMILAVIPRLVLLLAIPLVLAMKDPLFTIPFIADPGHGGHGKGLGLSLQDLVVLVGGIFLIYKATHEIHGKLEGEDEHAPGASTGKAGAKFSAVMVQIMVINLIFSLDSIVTAIGIIPPEQVMVMMIAVII
jgi:predicted tellurium resistance membrane protein TerC